MMIKKLGIVLLGVSLAACNVSRESAEGEKEERNEVKVAIDQVPAAVQATLAQQAPGVTIGTVDKEEENGTTTYEADAVMGGQNYEIRVAADGKLISKKADNEADEKKGEEKEEKK